MNNIARIRQQLVERDLDAILIPENYTGRSASQVDAFLRTEIRPLLEENRALLGEKAELNV